MSPSLAVLSTFLSELRNSFIRTLNLDDEHIIAPKHSHLFAAIGSALNSKGDHETSLTALQTRLAEHIHMDFEVERMEPLFASEAEYQNFKNQARASIRFLYLISPPTRETVFSGLMQDLPQQKRHLSAKMEIFFTLFITAMMVIR